MLEPPQRGVLVDTTEFPLVLVWFGKTYTDSEWQGSLDRVGELARGQVRFVVLNVTRPDMDTPTARQRKAVADWNTAYVASGQDTILGWGSVIESHVLRGVITAISWLTTLTYEQKVVANLNDGIAWARQLLARGKR